MKYSEIKTALDNAETTTRKQMACALRSILQGTQFEVRETKSRYEVDVYYKDFGAFTVYGAKDWRDNLIKATIVSYNGKTKMVAREGGRHSWVRVITDTDEDAKRIDRKIAKANYLEDSPFLYKYGFQYAIATRTFYELKNLLEKLHFYQRELVEAHLPDSVGNYIESLADMSRWWRSGCYDKQKFLEELPKAYTKVLDLIAKDNSKLAGEIQTMKTAVKNYIEERKNRRIF